jgi:hypothetical protein
MLFCYFQQQLRLISLHSHLLLMNLIFLILLNYFLIQTILAYPATGQCYYQTPCSGSYVNGLL